MVLLVVASSIKIRVSDPIGIFERLLGKSLTTVTKHKTPTVSAELLEKFTDLHRLMKLCRSVRGLPLYSHYFQYNLNKMKQQTNDEKKKKKKTRNTLHCFRQLNGMRQLQ